MALWDVTGEEGLLAKKPDDYDEARDEESPLTESLSALAHIDPTDRWVELIAASVLALATIASAWSAYQATRWSGVQAVAFADAGALRAESVRASDLADAELTVDVEYFAIWLDGVSRGDETLMALLEEQFRPEFARAFVAWQATDPLTNPNAPHSPFDMAEYQVAAAQQAQDLRLEAEEAAAVGLEANQTGDNYVLTTVLFASVLFFAGISTKFRNRGIRVALLVFGFAAFVIGASILVSFPLK
jgi:hypothetical protein